MQNTKLKKSRLPFIKGGKFTKCISIGNCPSALYNYGITCYNLSVITDMNLPEIIDKIYKCLRPSKVVIFMHSGLFKA